LRLLYDSITASDIPATAQMVGGYCDGLYRWSDADWARFPNAAKVRIATQWTTNDGHVGDVENGDMTPTTALTWVRTRRRNGVEPTLYCTEGSMSAIAQVFDGVGEPEPHYWIATLDGSKVALGGSIVANQYAGSSLSGGHYDLSNVLDFWPGVDGQGGASNVTDSEKDAWTRLAFVAGCGREPSLDDLLNYRGAYAADGSNVGQIVTGVLDSPEAQAWRAHLHSVGTTGPAGPPGPAGPAGPQGPPGSVPHSATITGTINLT